MHRARASVRPSFPTRLGPLVLLILSLALVAGCGKDPTKPNIPPAQTVFHVNAATGMDTNDGTSGRPFKTLTHALAAADSGTSILVAPGTYDAANGEVFPLVLKPRQTLVGDTLNKGGAGGSATTIWGHGASNDGNAAWLDQFATLVSAPGATICGFRIGSTYETLYFGITTHGSGVTVANNTFDISGYGGVVLNGAGRSLIRANSFSSSAYGVYINACTESVYVQANSFVEGAWPIVIAQAGGESVIRDNAIWAGGWSGIQVQSGSPLIDYNRFNRVGAFSTYGAIVVLSGGAAPKLRNNLFNNVALGVRVQDGAPDLGTAGEWGGNNFMSVTGPAVKHEGGLAISAIGNTWQHGTPTPGVDIVVTGAGSVRWGTGTEEIVPPPS